MAKRSRRSRRASATRRSTQTSATRRPTQTPATAAAPAAPAAPAVNTAAETAQAEEDFAQEYDYVYSDLRMLVAVSILMVLLMIGLSYFF